MRSDNEIKTMKLNRFLAKGKVMPFFILAIDLVLFFLFNYTINTFSKLGRIVNDIENAGDYMGLENILPNLSEGSDGRATLYLFMLAILLVLDGIMAYQIRTSLGDKEMNHGQKGTARWTTPEEVTKQYKAIPLKDKFYDGQIGSIVQRQGKKLYIDDSKSNTLVYGTTRSGKGEMLVFPSIDVYSRTKRMEDRPSMIISDPKPELYKSCKATLEKRGYKVRFLNLDDPMHSMGYNPLQLVIDYYKTGYVERAQMAAKTFSFSIFAADNGTQEPIWKNTATDLFTALIIAITTDCLEADRVLNEARRQAWQEKRNEFADLSPEEQDLARKRYEGLEKTEEDPFLSDYVSFIPTEIPFTEVHKNEKKVSCFSCLNFFRELCDRKALDNAESQEAREKMAETALDEYFNNRPPLDFAKSLYQEIKTAGDRTKGSVYLNMQSAVSIFALDNIARLTAENDVDFEELGYGQQPVAIFIGIPSEDRSNHFLVTTFIAQVYQRLFQLSKTHDAKQQGKLDRPVKFVLDEFGNFPEIENFAGFATVCLGLGISFDIYAQAQNQITSKYKDDAKTIFENFANQIYIKSVGRETAEDFSELLGKKTVVEIQRSGSRSSLDKNFTETVSDKPLMYPDEFARLREGECVLYRGIKRTDRLGVAIDSFPIINEYADQISFTGRMETICSLIGNRLLKHEKIKHPSEDRDTTISEEWRIRKNRRLQEEGTALLYRWQYLKDTFPDPDTIRLEEVNTESRSHIDYTQMVYDPQEVLAGLSAGRKKLRHEYTIFENLTNYGVICAMLRQQDTAYEKHLAVSGKDTVSRITEAVCGSPFPADAKEQILIELDRRWTHDQRTIN